MPALLPLTCCSSRRLSLAPPEYDGMLCLGELTESANENAVRVCFSPFGTIVNFEPGTNPARLTFLEHESAVHAAAADTPNSICSFVCVTWNDRAYTNRGWVGCAHSNSQLLKACESPVRFAISVLAS